MALVFNMGSKAILAADIDDTDTTILLNTYNDMLAKGGSGDSYYAQMIDVQGTKEIVLVDVGNSDPISGLSVTRGVEGTAAKDWGRGTIIWQVMSEASWEMIDQASIARQFAFIPDGVLVSAYFGEKIYQTDLLLWWKSAAAASTEWRLIAGVILTEAPQFSPPAGTYANGTLITITSATPGSAIYYTIDGSDPDNTDTLYTVPFALPDDATTTLKAIAYGPERWQSPSNITSGSYTMQVLGWVEETASGIGGGQPAKALVYNSKLYALASLGTLREWDGVSAIPSVAPTYFNGVIGSCTSYGSDGLIVHNSLIYGSVSPSGSAGAQLVEWNGSNAWIQRCGDLDVFNAGGGGAGPLILHSGTLYLCTSGGRIDLFQWNGVGTLTKVAPTPGGPPGWSALGGISFGGSLYVAGSPGNLYQWNGVNAYASVAPPISANIWSLVDFGGNLYGGTSEGTLQLWNGSNAWSTVVNAPTVASHNARCFVRASKVWFCSQDNGILYSWDGIGSAWTVEAVQLDTFKGRELADFGSTVWNFTATPDTSLLRLQ